METGQFQEIILLARPNLTRPLYPESNFKATDTTQYYSNPLFPLFPSFLLVYALGNEVSCRVGSNCDSRNFCIHLVISARKPRWNTQSIPSSLQGRPLPRYLVFWRRVWSGKRAPPRIHPGFCHCSAGFIAVGDLNVIAPIISNFFSRCIRSHQLCSFCSMSGAFSRMASFD